MKKRIVVTGMGVVSCFGSDVEAFYEALLEGRSGAAPVDSFPCEDYPTRFAAAIKDFDPGQYIEKKQARRIDKYIAYGLVAGKKALEDAGLGNEEALTKLNKLRCGVIIGSGMGGMGVFEEGVRTLDEKGCKRVTPFLVPYIIPNMASGLLAIDAGFMGPNYSVSTACATFNNAFIAAATHIRNGDADVMVCGGAEAAITPLGLAGFCACKALSQRNDEPTKASRPWDKNRDGFLMGEGAGVLVLESLEHALARGATIYAEYLGGGISCDAHHITEPRSDSAGVIACLNNALADSGITPDAVNYINAHATSTPAGDVAELNAFKKVFPNTKNIAIGATKSMIGHSLGAAGALEAVATIKSIQRGIVPPTINLENPEDISLEFNVPTKATEYKIDVAMSTSFGFGGHNATIVLARYEG